MGAIYDMNLDANVDILTAKFDLTMFDVFGEDYVIPEVTITATSAQGSGYNTLTGTTCADIEAYFPNDMLSDTPNGNPFCTLRGASQDTTTNGASSSDWGADHVSLTTDGATIKVGAAFPFDYGKGNPGFIKDFMVTHAS